MRIISLIRKIIKRIFVGETVVINGIEFVFAEAEIDKYHNKGIKYLCKKKYEKAIEQFKKEIECDDGDYLGYQELGRTYLEMGKIEESRKNYGIALKNAEQRYKEHPEMMEEEIIDKIKEEMKTLG